LRKNKQYNPQYQPKTDQHRFLVIAELHWGALLDLAVDLVRIFVAPSEFSW
jgi:hypothetical protein